MSDEGLARFGSRMRNAAPSEVQDPRRETTHEVQDGECEGCFRKAGSNKDDMVSDVRPSIARSVTCLLRFNGLYFYDHVPPGQSIFRRTNLPFT
jgi:hypothetical protein